MNPREGSLNQQCYLTVMSKDRSTSALPQMQRYPEPYLTEGDYVVELSGGGGGGGGGSAMTTGGGGGGGAGAAPFETVVHLSPGIYKLTIGRGGRGGWPDYSRGAGVSGADGSPTSIVNVSTGQTVAGYEGADRWTGGYSHALADSSGAPAMNLGGPGGSGGQGEPAVGRSTAATGTGSTYGSSVVYDRRQEVVHTRVGGMDTSPYSPSLHEVPGAVGRASGETMVGTHVVGGMDVSPFAPNTWDRGMNNATASAYDQGTTDYSAAPYDPAHQPMAGNEAVRAWQQSTGRSSGETMAGSSVQSSSDNAKQLGAGGGGGAAVQSDAYGRIISSSANNGTAGGDGYIALRAAPQPVGAASGVTERSSTAESSTTTTTHERTERPRKRDRN